MAQPDDLVTRFQKLLDERGIVTQKELSALNLLAHEYLGNRSVRRRGPCIRCKTALRYGRLSPPHLRHGDGFLQRLATFFGNVNIEKVGVSFPGEGVLWHPEHSALNWRSWWRSRRGAVHLIPPKARDKSYRWDYLSSYLCPRCAEGFEIAFDARWPAWVEEVKNRHERELEARVREQEQWQKEEARRQQRSERQRQRRALAKENASQGST